MTDRVAFCGLICHTCPIFLASRQKNKQEQAKMRAAIVQQCREHYGLIYKLDDITDCDGCRTESGRLFPASKKCHIRKCASQKGIENCAYCAEYACAELESFLSAEPSAQARLTEIRNGILKSMKS